MAIEAVLFDLDGTLFDRDKAVVEVATRQVAQFPHLIPATRASAFIERLIALDAHGHRDKREVYATLGEEFGFEATSVDALHASFWLEYPRCCRPQRDVSETLTVLPSPGGPVGARDET